MRFTSDPSDRPTRSRDGQRRVEFRRLRDQRWNKLTIWRYFALLILVILLLKFLYSLTTSP